MACVVTAARKSSPGALETELRRLVAASGAEVGLAFKTLDGRSQVLIEPDKSFHAASTLKVPIMIELFRQAETGRLTLDDQLAVRNEFHSIVDGSVYQLSVGDDSDAEHLMVFFTEMFGQGFEPL